jgi:hypothetical protein
MINFPGEPGRYDLRSGHLLSAVDPVFFNFLTVSVDWLEGGHLVKRYAIVILALMLLVMTNGCAWLDYQETKLHSGSIYLPVDAEAQNFGYQRLMINCRYREPVNTFIQTHGYPEFIYEYNKAAREGIRLFYLKENKVADFLEQGLSPNSATLIDHRALDSYEKAEIKELQGRQPL